MHALGVYSASTPYLVLTPAAPRLLQPITSAQIAQMAVASLYGELVLHPKPGLVTPFSNGSHSDMTAHTFMRSLFTLRHYFKEVSQAGRDGNEFDRLRQLGINAEQRMLRATAGVNTHRGAIFSVGLLCAAIGATDLPHNANAAHDADMIRRTLLRHWGEALRGHTRGLGADSHGAQARSRYGVEGAREQAAAGFPAVFDNGLPQLRATLATGRDWTCACLDTLFVLMADLHDTNVVHRGGVAGTALVRRRAREFMSAGGTANLDWRAHATGIGQEFERHNLSPGGAADLLAATCLVYRATISTDVAN